MGPAPNPPPDVSLFLPSLGGGGAQLVMARLAGAFVERGLRVDMLLAHREGPYLSELHPEVRLIDLDTRVRNVVPALVQYLRSERPGAAMATMTSPSIALAVAGVLAGGGTRVVLRQASLLGPRQRPWLVRAVYRLADRVVAPTALVRDDLVTVGRLPSDRIVTVPNPAFPSDAGRLAAEPVDHPWFSDDVPVVIGVGRMSGGKGFAPLIRSVAVVRERRPIRLVILGEGPERPTLEREAEAVGVADAVWMPGFVPNPLKYVARSDVFVSASEAETFGNVVVEAMAVGTPVVCTAGRNASASLLDGGRWGVIVGPGAAALAAGLERALDAPPAAGDGLRRAARAYRLEPVADRYLEVLGVWPRSSSASPRPLTASDAS